MCRIAYERFIDSLHRWQKLLVVLALFFVLSATWFAVSAYASEANDPISLAKRAQELTTAGAFALAAVVAVMLCAKVYLDSRADTKARFAAEGENRRIMLELVQSNVATNQSLLEAARTGNALNVEVKDALVANRNALLECAIARKALYEAAARGVVAAGSHDGKDGP